MSKAPAALLLACALAACGGSSQGSTGNEAGKLGADVYAQQGCTLCHGPDGAGTTLGPPLRGLAAHWTREDLARYLKDPVAYGAKDPRLAEQGKKYSLPMQKYDKVPDAELAALAEHLLGLP